MTERTPAPHRAPEANTWSSVQMRLDWPALAPEFDSKLASWETGRMKLTVDLPDDLLLEAKIRAIREGKKFKETMAGLFTLGLDLLDAKEATKSRRTAVRKAPTG